MGLKQTLNETHDVGMPGFGDLKRSVRRGHDALSIAVMNGLIAGEDVLLSFKLGKKQALIEFSNHFVADTNADRQDSHLLIAIYSKTT